jgi:hypothetical protein
MAQRCGTVSCLVLVSAALATAACRGQHERLHEHQTQFESLGSTTAAIGEAWLARQTSKTYTHTALARTFRRVEQERTALASSPVTLLDPQAAQLSQRAEQLSRLIAAIMRDVEAVDDASARRDLTHIPIMPSTRP